VKREGKPKQSDGKSLVVKSKSRISVITKNTTLSSEDPERETVTGSPGRSARSTSFADIWDAFLECCSDSERERAISQRQTGLTGINRFTKTAPSLHLGQEFGEFTGTKRVTILDLAKFQEWMQGGEMRWIRFAAAIEAIVTTTLGNEEEPALIIYDVGGLGSSEVLKRFGDVFREIDGQPLYGGRLLSDSIHRTVDPNCESEIDLITAEHVNQSLLMYWYQDSFGRARKPQYQEENFSVGRAQMAVMGSTEMSYFTRGTISSLLKVLNGAAKLHDLNRLGLEMGAHPHEEAHWMKLKERVFAASRNSASVKSHSPTPSVKSPATPPPQVVTTSVTPSPTSAESSIGSRGESTEVLIEDKDDASVGCCTWGKADRREEKMLEEKIE